MKLTNEERQAAEASFCGFLNVVEEHTDESELMNLYHDSLSDSIDDTAYAERFTRNAEADVEAFNKIMGVETPSKSTSERAEEKELQTALSSYFEPLLTSERCGSSCPNG